MRVQCDRCQQSISIGDTLSFDGDHIVHLDCRRPRDLSHEERKLLFRYCFDHVAVECAGFARGFRQQELGADLLIYKTNLCPSCRLDLTDALRSHLYACGLLPGEVRRRAQEAREATQKLIKRSQEMVDHADVLMREAEAARALQRTLLQEARAALAALRETMRRQAPHDSRP